MIKYILHGGNTRESNADNESFFQEIISSAKDETLLLLNYFARKEEDVERCAQEDIKRISEKNAGKNITFEIAHPDNFTEQLSRADIMYMRGGETKKLIQEISKVENIKKLCEGKVIAGSSAGVYALCKYYWSNDTNELGEGLGLLNLKAICHYGPEREIMAEKLVQHGNSIPLLTLSDHKWIIMFE